MRASVRYFVKRNIIGGTEWSLVNQHFQQWFAPGRGIFGQIQACLVKAARHARIGLGLQVRGETYATS